MALRIKENIEDEDYCIELIQFAEEVRRHLGFEHTKFINQRNFCDGDSKQYYIYGCCQNGTSKILVG
jgi:hypothetical protein